MELRPHQKLFVDSVESGWNQFTKQLAVAPTGCGKTIMFSHLADRLFKTSGQKTLILCHRDELIEQAMDKLHRATGIVAEKEKAEFRATKHCPVVVASIQSMIRRLGNWAPDHFGMVVCDEAHHSLSDSWKKVLNHFDGHANVLGVTATPDRGDKRSLGEYYENIASEISLIDLIKQQFLSPITIRSVPLKIDLNEVKQLAGDFDSGELGNIIEPYLKQIAMAILEFCVGRKTLCFLPLIATSKKFTDICVEAGLSAKHIDGESPDRAEILESYAKGDFQVLNNAMLLTEGYDCPDISCIVVLRPTRSRPLFAQMVGRGTRIAPGKKDLLLLDFLWLHDRHKIVHPASLVAKSDEESESITRLAEEHSGLPDDVVENQLDLIELAAEASTEREEALREKLAAMAGRKERFISAEQFAVNHNSLAIAEFEPTMKWHKEPITEKQVIWLEKAAVNIDTVQGKGHASQILTTYFDHKKMEPASSKQKWVMRQSGWSSEDGLRDAGSATQDEARIFFAKRNGAKA